MGRPRAVRRFTLNAAQLKGLEDWCEGILRNAATHGNVDPSMTVRCVVMRTLIQQARFGTGLATINAQSPAARSAAATRAARARWDARKLDDHAGSQITGPGNTGDDAA